MNHPRLTIEIEARPYTLTRCGHGWYAALPGGRGAYLIEWRDGAVRCSCPHYTHRLRDTGGRCKHGAALFAVGLIEPHDDAEDVEDTAERLDESVPPDRPAARD